MPKSFLVTALEPSANLHLKEVLKAFWAEFGEQNLRARKSVNCLKS